MEFLFVLREICHYYPEVMNSEKYPPKDNVTTEGGLKKKRPQPTERLIDIFGA
jgi:hypothetical protein